MLYEKSSSSSMERSLPQDLSASFACERTLLIAAAKETVKA